MSHYIYVPMTPRIDFRLSFLIQREDVNIPQGRTVAALLGLLL